MSLVITMKDIELHVHPFLGEVNLIDVVEAMDKAELGVAALESFNDSLYGFIVEETKRIYPLAVIDSSGVRIPGGIYILNAREYDTNEKLHVITVGYSMDEAVPDTEIRRIIDNGLENNALVLLNHPFVDNGKTRTAGHIPNKLEIELEKLCKEYSGQVALEWNSYCIPWMRKFLKLGLNSTGLRVKYYDVNKKAEELSQKLKLEGHNCPIVADTDLHARNKRHLRNIGTGRIRTETCGESPKEIVDSIKKNIFAGKYENIKKYVSSLLLLEAFCLPVLFPKYFEKPRA